MKLLNRFFELFLIKKNSNRYTNSKEITIFSNNCLAGVMYKNIGLKFCSPTINCSMNSYDYLFFVENYKEYLSSELLEDLHTASEQKHKWPVGLLGGGGELPQIRIMFNHYHTFQEAKKCWDRRKERVNYNKVCFLFEFYSDIYPLDILKQFLLLSKNRNNYRAIVHNKENIIEDYKKNCFFVRCYKNDKPHGNIFKYYSIFSGKRNLEEIDYVSWLNHI